jgi:hypothetical protein
MSIQLKLLRGERRSGLLLVATALAIAAWTAGALAQQRPSFSGSWKPLVDQAAQDRVVQNNSGWTEYSATTTVAAEPMPLSVTQDDKTLTVAFDFDGPVKIVYNLDGSASTNRFTFRGVTTELRSTAKWSGANLLIVTAVMREGQRTEVSETWSLDAAGTLVVDRTSRGDRPPVTTKTTYKKAALQTSGPTVSAIELDGGGSAFLIKATNETSRRIAVTADGRCRMRLDGDDEKSGSGGSSGAHEVAPGDTWQEIVRLVTWSPDPTGRRPANPRRDTVWAYREIQVSLASGDHVIQVSCGGEWSSKMAFHWKGLPQ